MVLRKWESRKPPPYMRLEKFFLGSLFLCYYFLLDDEFFQGNNKWLCFSFSSLIWSYLKTLFPDYCYPLILINCRFGIRFVLFRHIFEKNEEMFLHVVKFVYICTVFFIVCHQIDRIRWIILLSNVFAKFDYSCDAMICLLLHFDFCY